MVALDQQALATITGASVPQLQPQINLELPQTTRLSLVPPAGDKPTPEIENFRVVIEVETSDTEVLQSRPLRVSVDKYSEQGVTEFQATLLSDRAVIGYGDSPDEAINDMADMLESDFLFLIERVEDELTADVETHYRQPGGGTFAPQNYNRRFHGPVRYRAALARSMNVAAFGVAQVVRKISLLSLLRRLGFRSLDRSARHYGLGLVVGNGEVTLLELTGAYMALARGGRYLTPRFLRAARDVDGKELLSAAAGLGPLAMTQGEPVMKSEHTFLVSHILSDPLARLPGFGLVTPFNA